MMDESRRGVIRPGVGIEVGLLKHLAGKRRTNAVNVRKRSFNALLIRDINAEESCHGGKFVK